MARDVDPRFDPVFQRGYDGPSPSVAEALEATPRPLVEPPTLVEALETSPTPERAGRNPWLGALWIVAAVFTVTGVAAQYASQALLQRGIAGSAIDYYVIPATVQALSPWFTLAGLFAGVAALVLSAVRWRPELE